MHLVYRWKNNYIARLNTQGKITLKVNNIVTIFTNNNGALSKQCHIYTDVNQNAAYQAEQCAQIFPFQAVTQLALQPS